MHSKKERNDSLKLILGVMFFSLFVPGLFFFFVLFLIGSIIWQLIFGEFK